MILDSGLLFLAPLYTERKYFDNDLQKGTHSISCCQIFNTLSKLANVYSTHTETLLQKRSTFINSERIILILHVLYILC